MTGSDDRPDRLLADAAEGDAGAWRTLVETYSPRVFALVMHQCRNRDLAEEIAQATFVKLVTQIGKKTSRDNKEPGEQTGGKGGKESGGGGYEERGRFEPWLFRIAMNLLRDEMRRRSRQARTMDFGTQSLAGSGQGEQASHERSQRHATDPLEQASASEQIERLKDAIGQLPKADQEVLHLRHTAGLSFLQIAKSLDQPLGTVLARGHRALAKLRKILGDPPQCQAS